MRRPARPGSANRPRSVPVPPNPRENRRDRCSSEPRVSSATQEHDAWKDRVRGEPDLPAGGAQRLGEIDPAIELLLALGVDERVGDRRERALEEHSPNRTERLGDGLGRRGRPSEELIQSKSTRARAWAGGDTDARGGMRVETGPGERKVARGHVLLHELGRTGRARPRGRGRRRRPGTSVADSLEPREGHAGPHRGDR